MTRTVWKSGSALNEALRQTVSRSENDLPDKPLMLDSGPLGWALRTGTSANAGFREWLSWQLQNNRRIYIPEIADYEVRRNLILERLTESLDRLDALKNVLHYAPLTTSVMKEAARMWANMRRKGQPAADRHALDGDVILAAQALAHGAVIITTNLKHLDRIAPAMTWEQLRQ